MLRCGVVAIVILMSWMAPVDACTGVVITGDGRVVVGGNEDWVRFDSHVWAEAATDEAFGAVYFGYQIRGEFGPRGRYWFEFQGVNDQGLYFDTFGAPTLPNPNWAGKPSCTEHIEITMMETCATVAEAIDVLQSTDLSRYLSYNERMFRSNMTFFPADRTGAAALVDAEHIHWMEGEYFVTTNFRPSNLSRLADGRAGATTGPTSCSSGMQCQPSNESHKSLIPSSSPVSGGTNPTPARATL